MSGGNAMGGCVGPVAVLGLPLLRYVLPVVAVVALVVVGLRMACR